MQKQKACPVPNRRFWCGGQIHIIVLVLLVVGFIIYANFSGPGIGKWLESYKIKPTPQTPSSSVPDKIKGSLPSSSPPPAELSDVPDTVPPVRLNPKPLLGSALPSETRKTTIGLETNEKATCKHSTVDNVHYDSMQGFFDQVDATSHSTLITTLSEGMGYVYFVKCTDKKGNKNSTDFIINFSVSAPVDVVPPVLSNPSHKGDVLPAETASAVISISTNEFASCRYSTTGGIAYNSMSGSFSQYDQTGRFHVKQITGLTNGKSYDFFVRCKDTAGNANTGDVLISFSVKP